MPREPDDDIDPMAETQASDEPEEAAFESLLRHVAHAPGSTGPETSAATALAPGTVVGGRFEVIEEIGRGGFARVYRARDRVLSRPVAIKLLARRRRLSDRDLELFYREAQATARLNHVHIVTAYDWGEWNGTPFLVLELLEGEPLSALLARGPVGEARAFTIARDVARALAYAHAEGVLHLDLKSQNVFVVRDDRIKVLDFGLAGLDWDEAVPGGISRIAGGTPATMAPEQAEGGATDARTDVWAVGVILHELLVGRLPDKLAEGAPTATPPPGASRPALEILRRTLARDPAARFPDAASLLAALEATAAPRRWRRAGLAAAIGVAAATAATAALVTRLHRGAPVPPPPAASAPAIAPPSPDRHRQLTFSGDVFESEISPDGTSFAYVGDGGRELWVRALDSDQPRKLFAGARLDGLRWFPDGTRLVVRDVRTRENVLWIVPGDGAPPRQIPYQRAINVPLPGGDALASVSLGFRLPEHPDILVAPLAGGGETRIPLPESATIIEDVDVAEGRRFLVATPMQNSEIWSVRQDGLAELLYAKRPFGGGARWDRGGEGVFFVQGSGHDAELLWMPPKPEARPTTLVTGVGVGRHLSLSRDGRRLLYQREATSANLVRLSRAGALLPLTRGTAETGLASVSPNGRSIAYALREDVRHSIMVAALEGGGPARRIVRCAAPCLSPAWSPDGERIAFTRHEPTGWRIVVVRADGTGERIVEKARPTDSTQLGLAWWTDGEIVYQAADNGPLRRVELDGGADRPLLDGPASGWMFQPLVSPDRTRVTFYWNRGHGDRGVWIAGRDGQARLAFRGTAHAIAWTSAEELVLAREDLVGEPTSVISLEHGDLRVGATEVFWRPPAGVEIEDAIGIPGTRDLILLQRDTRSDAWLVENPLGP